MRRYIISSTLLILLAITALGQDASKQGFTRTVKMNKAYAVNADCTVEITNKYGNIHLIPWTKDSVVIEVAFTARGNSQEKVDKLVNYIGFDFTHTRYYVVARTYFKDYANSLWTDISNMAGTLFSGGNSVEINYAVYLPVRSHLKIDHKFGNVYTTNHEGSVNLTISNGDLKANNLNGDSRININFGNGNINYIAKGTLDVSYADFFDIRETVDLVINSKSSRITIEKAKNLEIHSRRDKYAITSVSGLTSDCSFSYLNIYGLGRDARIESKYGSTSIQGIGNSFSSINISSTYTDNSIYFEKDAAYRFEILHDKKATLSLPSSFKGIRKELINTEEGIYQVTGTRGSNPSGRMRIDTRSGSVTIVQK